MEMKIIEMEMVELQEKPWKAVGSKKNQLMRRARWDELPSLALSNIFIKLDLKDRCCSIPLVCKAWNSVISNDPCCWSSMIPETISPDDAYINKPVYSVQVDLPSKLFYRRDRPVPIGGKSDDPSICPGVSYLRTFIKKSSCSSVGGSSFSSSSTITSLCLDRFSFSYPNNESVDHDEILHLIAHCCPNLKHISFDGFYCASIEAVLEVFHRCKKIELIDFSDSPYADSVQVIEELVNCLPNLRGIRCNGYSIPDAIGNIATHFPWIKLHYEELIQYSGCEECVDESLRRVRVNRPRLHPRYRRLCYYCWLTVQEEGAERALLKFGYDRHCDKDEENREYSILKEKKKKRRRYHQYVRVDLRSTRMTKKNKKQKQQQQQQQQQEAASFILKMKMRKKRDTYNDYQDFYVRAAACTIEMRN